MRWASLLVLVLAVPTAGASAVEGALEVEGDVALPPASELRESPLAVFVPDAAALGFVEARFPSAMVQVFEVRSVSASVGGLVRPAVPIGDERPSWVAQGLTLRAGAARAGWLGVHVGEGDLAQTTEGSVQVRSEDSPTIGHAGVGSDPEEPDELRYAVRAEGPTLVRHADAWTYSGSGALHLIGPTVLLETATNESRVETGQFEDPDAPGQIVRRWVVVTFDEGAIRAQARADVASRALAARIDGTLELPSAQGALDGPLRGWRASGGPASLEGAFEATLVPEPGGAQRLAIAGDLRATSLAGGVASARGGGAGWAPIVVAAAVVGGAAAIAARRATRRAAAELPAEDYATLADAAADEGDFERAAALAAKARARSPSSRRLALDHAYYAHRAGQSDDALAILADGPAREDPEARLLAARIHLDRRDEDRAARALAEALAMAPLTLLDADTDPAYAPLLRRRDVREAVRRARAKLE